MFPLNIFKNIKPVTDSDEQLRVHILWFLFIRVILYTLLLGISLLLHTEEQWVILPPTFFTFLYILFIYVFSIGSALLLQKKKLPLKWFAQFQTLADTLFIALLVYATGCSQSIFTAVFILPIIVGGLILYKNGGLITAASATLFYAVVLISEYLQMIPSYFYESRYSGVTNFLVSMNIFAVYGLTFFLLAMLSGILAQRLRTTEDALSLTELRFDRLVHLYKQIFVDIITGIITVDNKNNITSFNPAAENITGFAEKDINTRPLHDIFPQITVDTSERLTADLIKKDGSRIRIGYSCSKLNMPLRTDQDYGTCDNCKVITLQDISRVEQMELQMRKAEKMAAIGELSASIAHDFRNPLAAISGSAQILAMELADQNIGEDTTQHSLTHIILRESDRLARTITDFLHYARPMPPDPQWFNLNRFCLKTIELLKREPEFANCRIKTEIPENLDICADRQLLQLALTHLLKNSCYAAIGSTEPILFRAGEEKDGSSEEENIFIEIKDKGIGIDPSTRDKLFDPFYSTREDATGMGLAIVKQVVAGHSGTIEIQGKPNEGCRVYIRLPLPETTPAQSV